MTIFRIVITAIAIATTAATTGPASSVPIKDVDVLTLQSGEFTTGRRTLSLPQLHCKGRNCRLADIKTVHCKNVGSDGIDALWECKSEMDTSVRFGTLNVICEGYDYPKDPNILSGSCGLEYTLVKTGPRQVIPQDEGNPLIGLMAIVVFISCLCSCLDDSGPGFWTGFLICALLDESSSSSSSSGNYSISTSYASTSRR